MKTVGGPAVIVDDPPLATSAPWTALIKAQCYPLAVVTSSAVARGGHEVSIGRTVLRDDQAEAELREFGVATLPFLSETEVASLSSAYWDAVPEGDHGLTVDYMRPDRSIVRRLSTLLTELWQERLGDLAVNHRVVMATFVVKHPGAESAMFLHDDRSYVDERLHRAATIWIPLVDVGPGIANGGLQVVPRSHLLPTGWSGSNTPDMIRPFEAALRKALVPITAPAGTAVVYDTRVLHASEPNLSDLPRVAVVCAIAPCEARLVHVVADGHRHRRIHAIDDEFFLDHHPREIELEMPADCPVIDEVDDVSSLTSEQVRDVLGLPGLPVKDVPVPADVAEQFDGVATGGFRSVARPDPGQTDLRIPIEGPAPPAAQVAVLDVVDEQGSWTRFDLVRRFRSVRARPPGAERRGSASSFLTRDEDLFVMDPGARLGVRARSTPRWITELVVLEGPPVGAGIRGVAAVSSLEAGQYVDLPQGERLVIWNDGPGQLVILVARVPSGETAFGGLVRRLASRVRTG